MASTKQGDSSKPVAVADLEAAYGPPSQAGFGGAVFHQRLAAGDDLDRQALATYKHFVGELWDRFGEDAWMGPWKKVYAREPGTERDIVAELRGIADPDASVSVPLVLDLAADAESARAALAAVYDDPTVTDLAVYNLGDGGAMSGLLVAGRRAAEATATFVVVLMD